MGSTPLFRNSANAFLLTLVVIASQVISGRLQAAGGPPALPDGGSVSFDANNLPALITQGADKNKITIAPGAYTVNTGWTVKAIEVTVTPVAGGPNGGTVTATYINNLVWGGTSLGQVASILMSAPGGGAFPAGKYDVQAKITYEKGAGQSYQTVSTFSAKVTLEVK